MEHVLPNTSLDKGLPDSGCTLPSASRRLFSRQTLVPRSALDVPSCFNNTPPTLIPFPSPSPWPLQNMHTKSNRIFFCMLIGF